MVAWASANFVFSSSYDNGAAAATEVATLETAEAAFSWMGSSTSRFSVWRRVSGVNAASGEGVRCSLE